uniref:Secreted protein n=1 Tax=Ixodes ricinus TaxID=34613 RepID=A0A6B0UA06_IXORI
MQRLPKRLSFVPSLLRLLFSAYFCPPATHRLNGKERRPHSSVDHWRWKTFYLFIKGPPADVHDCLPHFVQHRCFLFSFFFLLISFPVLVVISARL